MWSSFFTLAAQSPTRQLAFRKAVSFHLAALTALSWMLVSHRCTAGVFGQCLLVAAIVEGAALVGWRLTQLPKSQALEFLLVSSLRPGAVFRAEAVVGIARLALVTSSGLPILLWLWLDGNLGMGDVAVSLVMPFTWGTITGLGLTVWAYEACRVRRWAERVFLVCLVLYLAICILAGENLRRWLNGMPGELGSWVISAFAAFHYYNPFGVLDLWFKERPIVAWDRMVGLEWAALFGIVVMMARAAWRLPGHFHDRHYRPIADVSNQKRGCIGDRPLSWWAVRRVREYSGRINLWLAAGFGGAYALYTVAGPHWPAWVGRVVFVVFDNLGGVPGLATALVVLAAVPAAFQYGLWDSNAQNRCRRLELLLLTELRGRDFWHAATAAAWSRGRGYFAIACLLWFAAAAAGIITVTTMIIAVATAVIVWCFYFTIGFWAFSRGAQANGLGSMLTIGLPLLVFAAHRGGWNGVAAALPPGGVYGIAAGWPSVAWLFGTLFAGALTLILARHSLRACDQELRSWYDRNHGSGALS